MTSMRVMGMWRWAALGALGALAFGACSNDASDQAAAAGGSGAGVGGSSVGGGGKNQSAAGSGGDAKPSAGSGGAAGEGGLGGVGAGGGTAGGGGVAGQSDDSSYGGQTGPCEHRQECGGCTPDTYVVKCTDRELGVGGEPNTPEEACAAAQAQEGNVGGAGGAGGANGNVAPGTCESYHPLGVVIDECPPFGCPLTSKEFKAGECVVDGEC